MNFSWDVIRRFPLAGLDEISIQRDQSNPEQMLSQMRFSIPLHAFGLELSE